VLNDSLLAGQLDCAATGFPSFLILWSKTRGARGIKGLMSYGNTPLYLLTRNNAVKTIADFADADRIAVPAVKSSVQAMMLQMAAEKLWGQFDKLDRLTVSRGHPDAIAALLSMQGEINSAFSAPPYQYQALENPGIRVVTTSEEIFGGPCSNGLLYMTEAFHRQNPAVVQAINLGMRDALDLINQDPRRAAEMYLETTGEKAPLELVLKTVTAPGTTWEAAPHGVMRFAEFMRRTGSIPKAPESWKDVFFPQAHDLPGD
jgi:NitT/TauT family transport system substrate-binding protein